MLLLDMILFDGSKLIGNVGDGDSLSFSFAIFGVRISFDQLLAKGADCQFFSILDIFLFLFFQFFFDFQILLCITLIKKTLLSQVRRNHLTILSIWEKVLPMQKPNSGIYTKSQLSLISTYPQMYLNQGAFT